ncbi:hypothetical protein QFC19_003100 [Naganishia cerealis]|uniref:Uncharacterized protein n=1 Tax=Naganishia cerealis TaxID=610337 RepID=A0ACC2W576_9TREE|nr:hypothetical protein QFC19_003100 [Naganishia cerealis]
MSTVYNSRLFQNIFGTKKIRDIFSDVQYVKYMVEAEICLAKAEGSLNVIPKEKADQIFEIAKNETFEFDYELMGNETDNVGYCVLPLLNQLTKKFPGDLGEYLHWGSTTQDIMDNASMLQIKDAISLVETYLQGIVATLKEMAAKYKDTAMPGRTHFQQALPITFGYKCAVWVSGIQRSIERLEQTKRRCLLAQFGGAAGTLASLGETDVGLKVRAELSKLLGLENPSITWHAARDGIAEIVSVLAIIGGSIGKIALDIVAMSSNEINEVSEPFVTHRGASSTMPQKRNPISSEYMLAASKILRANASLALDAMVVDFERASGPWHLEWLCVPESFIVLVGSLHQARTALLGLVVKPDSMAENLASSRGLIVAEAVMMGIAPFIGRHSAHNVVYESCVKAHDSGSSLLSVLKTDPKIVSKVEPQLLERLCDPKNYLGACSYMVDNVVQS